MRTHFHFLHYRFSAVFLLTTFYFLLTCSFAQAAEIRLESQKLNVRVGEEFIVDVIVSSEERLNAVEGKLPFPSELFSVQEIRDGNSVINAWVEKPEEKNNEIIFSGIAPGGFSGPNNLLFSVLVKAEGVGKARLSLIDTTALRNDGLGTEEPLSFRDVEISVKPGDSKVRSLSLYDSEVPEDFIPIISSDPNLFEGKQTLIFTTQDKGSGVHTYEVKEVRFPLFSFFSRWISTGSPYVLKDQELKSRISIKVTDFSGNERVVAVLPRYPLSLQDYLPIFGMIIVLFVLIVLVFKLKNPWKEKR